jgi:hypothetical protein
LRSGTKTTTVPVSFSISLSPARHGAAVRSGLRSVSGDICRKFIRDRTQVAPQRVRGYFLLGVTAHENSPRAGGGLVSPVGNELALRRPMVPRATLRMRPAPTCSRCSGNSTGLRWSGVANLSPGASQAARQIARTTSRLEPVSVECRTGLRPRPEFLPGNGLARPETRAGIFGDCAYSAP